MIGASSRGALVLASALAAGSACAEVPGQLWLNAGVYSLHFDRGKNLRDDNVGLGIEWVAAPAHAMSGGTFINSLGARTRYALYAWRPLRWTLAGREVSAGIAAGAFDGYPTFRNGGWFPAALPLVAIEGRHFGANLSVIPSIPNRLDGAISVQLKLRVW